MTRRMLMVVLAVALGASLITACGDDGGPSDAGGMMDGGMPMGGMDDGMPMDGMDGMMGGDGAQLDVAEDARQVNVTATSFEFDPAEIEAEVGEDLAIAVFAEDVTHTFTVDELGIDVSAQRGDTEVTGAGADEPGTYTYYCAVPGHREAGMEGTLVVA